MEVSIGFIVIAILIVITICVAIRENIIDQKNASSKNNNSTDQSTVNDAKPLEQNEDSIPEEEATKNFQISYNPIAAKLRNTADIIERNNTYTTWILLILGFVALFVIFIVALAEDDMSILASSILYLFLFSIISSIWICVSNFAALLLRGQAEIIQNTHVTAMMAVRNDKRNSK